MLSLLIFSCRSVGESMWPNWGWQLLDCRKDQKIQTVFGGIFVLHAYRQVELQQLILKHSTLLRCVGHLPKASPLVIIFLSVL